MKIIVCYKLVPEEQDIVVKRDKTLDFTQAQWKVGQYDLNAVEAGAQLAEAASGEVVVLTVGGDIVDNSKLKKDILSRGPARTYGVKDEACAAADSYAIAQVLKAGVLNIGDADLVICGEGSGDIYAQQVGPMLGALLGWPTVNAVNKVTAADGKVIVERGLENDVEVLEVALPAVISVTADINVPRIPGMKEILASGKKPATIWSLADVEASAGSVTETVSILAPEETERLQIVLEDACDEAIETLYNHLRKLV